MYYLAAFFVGLATGAVCLFLYFMDANAKIKSREKAAESAGKAAKNSMAETQAKEAALAIHETGLRELENQTRRIKQEWDHRIISYKELQDENGILKRDLQNIDVNLRKLELDGEVREQRQDELAARSTQLATRYLNETVKAVVASVGPSNFSSCKQKLIDVIGRCRSIGYDIPITEESRLVADLRAEFEREVRAAFEREEQARIKAQIREEERLKREIERELKQQERERAAIGAALDQALAAAQGLHTAEVERLQARMTELELKTQRTMSMAQQTKSGHVYIISNIGSFGEGVFKVGMTRRLTPQERVDELGCAAVPFPFDVHMMISCKDAPTLENKLHRALHRCRVNKANPRKEFFRVQLAEIHRIVIENHGTVDFAADAEAMEYRQTINMPADDAAYIESVFDEAEDEGEIVAD